MGEELLFSVDIANSTDITHMVLGTEGADVGKWLLLDTESKSAHSHKLRKTSFFFC